ncbi:MAG: ABC transporter permease [Synergistetes bacterium]|nr:ABC transporter permease [Synergistota bacterium]MDK2870770.1 ral nucleoside transport system permease protein [bacterium]
MRLSFEPRVESSKLFEISMMLLSVGLAFLIFTLFMFFTGRDPVGAYKTMFIWAFMRKVGLEGTLIKFSTLSLIALGLILAFKMKVWNIGGEGQFYVGAMFTTFLALFFLPSLHSALLIPLLALGGFIGGSIWAFLPGLMKAFLGADEIVVTLMLNYIAILWTDYLVYGAWKDPGSFGFPMTPIFPDSAKLPYIWGKVHMGILVPIALALVLRVILERTRWGFEIKVIGDNPDAASCAGMNIRKNIILTLMISGGIAGLSGALYVMGVQHRLQHGFSPGYGYTAIIVAWLSRLHPVAALLVSFFLGGIFVGCEILQIVMKLPISVVYIFQAILFICVLIGDVLIRYKVRVVR